MPGVEGTGSGEEARGIRLGKGRSPRLVQSKIGAWLEKSEVARSLRGMDLGTLGCTGEGLGRRRNLKGAGFVVLC